MSHISQDAARRLVDRRGAAAPHPPIAQEDEVVELAAALEIRAILEQIKEVAEIYPPDDMPTPFQSAWHTCCEEIFYRATGQQWHMDEDDGRRKVSGHTAGQQILQRALDAAPHPPIAQPQAAGWRPIEEAPRGSGEDGPSSVKHPDYVEPPHLLLWSEDGMRIGYYDWYFHPGYGMGPDGTPAWREAGGGYPIYGATHWQPLPEPPKEGA